MKASKLIVELDYDFEVCSLISVLKSHKLAWIINQVLNINLTKKEDLLFEFVKDKSKLYFINYKFETDFSYFRLIKNKSCEYYNSIKPYLIPELKEYDYLLLYSQSQILDKTIINKLKNVPDLEYVNKVELNTLKSKENLIF